MSFYRTLVATVAAFSLASAVFAAETTTATPDQQPAVKTEAAAVKKAPKMQKKAANAEQTGNMQQAEKIDLNKATAKELAAVKGLNANKARAIVTYRKKNGDFKSLEDLKQVKGFKRMDEKTLKDIQDQLTVG